MGKWGLDCDTVNTVNIELIESRWNKAKQDLEEAKYLEKLIFRDYVQTIKSYKTIWDYRIPMIRQAQTEIDKKKKKERENISYIEYEIKETFFKDKDNFSIKIHSIISGGVEGYYWSLCFNINEEEYIIQIPSREMLDINNIHSAHEGKFVFLKRTSSCSIAVLFDSWTEEEFAEKIKKYFETKEETTKEKEN